MTKTSEKPISFSYALKSFMGFLEGTKKSSHTIASYRSDLKTFQEFLESETRASRRASLEDTRVSDLENYFDYLKSLHLKSNTRRRKLLTVRRFMRYLNKRKKLPEPIGEKLPAPYKIERVPYVVNVPSLIQAIRELPDLDPLLRRNRLLLWTLAETGCQVSEICRFTPESWTQGDDGPCVIAGVKDTRSIPISHELYQEFQNVDQAQKSDWLFLGHNKSGPLKGHISPRGIELLVKSYRAKLGNEKLVPRTFRHSIAVHWFHSGVERDEIQARLGLKTSYAFRVYEPLFKRN